LIKLHATRLMRSGEVLLWLDGAIVWKGGVGADLLGIRFDAVSMHVDDSAQMTARVSKQRGADEILAALASWWG
jgi:hypothetical protein